MLHVYTCTLMLACRKKKHCKSKTTYIFHKNMNIFSVIMNKINHIYNLYIHDMYRQTNKKHRPDGVKVDAVFLFRGFFVTALTKCAIITGCYITKSSISLHLSLKDGFK